MKRKRESPLGLDLPFDEALRRFVSVDPKQIPEEGNRKRGPSKRPPPVVLDRLSGGDDKDERAPRACDGRADIL